MKIYVFDLDDTLAQVGKQAEKATVEKLKLLGGKIAVCSGKPVYYLCGFMRQLGIYDAVLIGENGAVLQFGTDLPPVRIEQPISKIAKNNLSEIKKLVSDLYPDMWFQPNEICVTPFPTTAKQFEDIDKELKKKDNILDDVDEYVHFDSIDFSPKGVSKASGVKLLAEYYGETLDNVFVIGNGNNDYPMFELVKNSVGINLSDKSKAKYNFPDINTTLDFLLETNCK